MFIDGIARGFPPHYASQAELTQSLATLWHDKPLNRARLNALHSHCQVGGRYTALPLDALAQMPSFTERNQAYLRVGGALASEVAQKALADAGLPATAVDYLVFTTVTGLGVPALDTRICNTLSMRPDIRRLPLFGLGCVGGAAGLARTCDLLRGHADGVALLVALELCSLTLQPNDISLPSLVASGLFGDGAAAVVVTGRERLPEGAQSARPRPAVVATQSILFPNSEHLLGWDISSEGFRVVLSGQLAEVLRAHLRRHVDAFLTRHSLTLANVASVICHPGGPNIMQAVEGALTLPHEALRFTRQSLADVGNVSSASILFVLEDTLRAAPPERGAYSLGLAFGPGFCCELVLFRW